MFENVAIKGAQGQIVWVYHTAIRLGRWSIRRAAGRPPKVRGVQVRKATTAQEWVLSAFVESLDDYMALQRPLLFTAPRKDGHWCWEVRALTLRDGQKRLQATLGPPLH